MAASLRSRARMDVHARRLGTHGARRNLSRLQPARWSPRRWQSRISELGHADGAASAWPGNDSISADVFGRIVDFTASRIPGTVSNRRDLPWTAAGRSSASAQCLRGTLAAVHGPAGGERHLGVLRWACGGAYARTRGLHPPGFVVGTSHGATQPPLAGLDAHQLWGDHNRIWDRPRQAGGLRLQWPRAQ